MKNTNRRKAIVFGQNNADPRLINQRYQALAKALSRPALLVYLSLVDRLGIDPQNPGKNKHGTVAFPSVLTIAKDTGLSGRTTQRGIAELVACGLLTRKQRFQDSNEYTVHAFEDIPPGDKTVTPPGDKTVTPPGDKDGVQTQKPEPLASLGLRPTSATTSPPGLKDHERTGTPVCPSDREEETSKPADLKPSPSAEWDLGWDEDETAEAEQPRPPAAPAPAGPIADPTPPAPQPAPPTTNAAFKAEELGARASASLLDILAARLANKEEPVAPEPVGEPTSPPPALPAPAQPAAWSPALTPLAAPQPASPTTNTTLKAEELGTPALASLGGTRAPRPAGLPTDTGWDEDETAEAEQPPATPQPAPPATNAALGGLVDLILTDWMACGLAADQGCRADLLACVQDFLTDTELSVGELEVYWHETILPHLHHKDFFLKKGTRAPVGPGWLFLKTQGRSDYNAVRMDDGCYGAAIPLQKFKLGDRVKWNMANHGNCVFEVIALLKNGGYRAHRPGIAGDGFILYEQDMTLVDPADPKAQSPQPPPDTLAG